MGYVELERAQDQRMNLLLDVTFNFFFFNFERISLDIGSGYFIGPVHGLEAVVESGGVWPKAVGPHLSA